MSAPAGPQPAARQAPLVVVVLAVRFLTELGLLAALAWAAAARTRNAAAAIALAVIAAVMTAAIWGAWIAPASRRRLPDPARLVLELALFGAAVTGLVLVGHPVTAAVLGGVGAGTAVGVRFLPQEPVRLAPDAAARLRRPRGRDRARPSR